MPFVMGMGLGVNWNLAAMGRAMPSLVGHLIFGAILGVTYRWLRVGTPQDSPDPESGSTALQWWRRRESNPCDTFL